VLIAAASGAASSKRTAVAAAVESFESLFFNHMIVVFEDSSFIAVARHTSHLLEIGAIQNCRSFHHTDTIVGSPSFDCRLTTSRSNRTVSTSINIIVGVQINADIYVT
jgi:hypothetical protein